MVPPAIAVGYLIYWQRTTEAGAFWGIALGYGVGLLWYGAIRSATAVDFTAGESASQWQQLAYTCFARDGVGIDPTYVATLIPLLAIPIISLMTREDVLGKDEFYAKLNG